MCAVRILGALTALGSLWACGSPTPNDFHSSDLTPSSTSGGSAGTGGASSGTTGSGGASGGSSGGSAGSGGSTGGGGSGGTAGSAGSSGSGGSGGTGGTAELPDDPIDTMEDGTPQIPVSGGRDGYWYSFGDMSDGQLQPAEGADFIMGYVDPPRDGSNRAARLQGQNFKNWGAAMAVAFRNNDLAYDVSAYDGVAFFARSLQGPLEIRVEFPDSGSSPHGGNCGQAQSPPCNQHFHTTIALVQEWTAYEIPFSSLKHEGSGSPTFDRSAVYGIQFTVGPQQSFDVWVDDLVFTR